MIAVLKFTPLAVYLPLQCAWYTDRQCERHAKPSVIGSICTPLNTVSSGSTPGVNRQSKGKTPQNTAHMHHICTLSGRKQPQEPCASTSSPSPSQMERGPGGEARDNPACTDRRVLPTIGSYR